MRKIYEYPMTIMGTQSIELPPHALFCGVHTRPETPDIPVLSVLHDARPVPKSEDRDEPEEEPELHSHTIRMVATGGDVMDDEEALSYVGTLRIRGGTYALHVFESW